MIGLEGLVLTCSLKKGGDRTTSVNNGGEGKDSRPEVFY